MDAMDVETAVTMETDAAAVAVDAAVAAMEDVAAMQDVVGITATARHFAVVSAMDMRKDSVTDLILQMTMDSRSRAADPVAPEALEVPADLAVAIAEAGVTEVVAEDAVTDSDDADNSGDSTSDNSIDA